jgi:uncharacterized membrane-anchored protein
VQSLIVIARAVLCAAFVCLSAHAQAAPADEAARKAELMAAWEAASKAGTGGPNDIALIDQGALKLPADYFYIPKSEGLRVLRALGNVVNDATFVGLVVGRRQNDDWMVVIKHIKEGYIKDDDAKNWNADELLSNLRAGADEANQDRVARGFPEMAVIGWVEPPAYDATTHRLVWSLLAKQKGEPDDAPKNVNYNTFALGRDGYFSLNLLSGSERIANDKAGTDRIAEYGLLALVGGVAAKKLGLLALAGAFVLKFAKIIIFAVVGFGAAVMNFFRRKPRNDNAGGPA